MISRLNPESNSYYSERLLGKPESPTEDYSYSQNFKLRYDSLDRESKLSLSSGHSQLSTILVGSSSQKKRLYKFQLPFFIRCKDELLIIIILGEASNIDCINQMKFDQVLNGMSVMGYQLDFG